MFIDGRTDKENTTVGRVLERQLAKLPDFKETFGVHLRKVKENAVEVEEKGTLLHSGINFRSPAAYDNVGKN